MAILYFFIHLGSTMLHKKYQVILIRNEGMTAFFVISHFHNIYVCTDIYSKCIALKIFFIFFGSPDLWDKTVFMYPLCRSIVSIGSTQFNIKINYFVFITLK